MAFDASLEVINNIAKITITGELDASTAPQLKAKLEEAAAEEPKRLVLMMEGLEYMASAGLRMLIFAKQKMGNSVDIYMVGTQEMVLDTITKTGFDQSVFLVNEYDEAQLEAA
ncbi:MAG: anti-sigma factor antagonist [Nostocales cyanobacterium 94392]|nr:anti-sigma factor antagonist [Nostocales cyanobacterium 94392]